MNCNINLENYIEDNLNFILSTNIKLYLLCKDEIILKFYSYFTIKFNYSYFILAFAPPP